MKKEKWKEAINRYIDENKEEMLGWLQRLIQLPSVVGQEEAAQQYYANRLKEDGLAVDFWYPKKEDMGCNPYFLPYRDDYSTSPNVVGHYKGLGGGRSLMLNGHVDVVPEGENDWLESPWSGSRKDGCIYGRGASDMKGGLIANLIAMHTIVTLEIPLKGDVYLASVIGEETGGAGTLSLIHRGYRADAAIIPEPSNLHICPVSLGVMWFRVRVHGVAAHAANAHLGVNAISKATILIHALDECNEKERMQRKHKLYYEVPNPFNINLGQMTAGNIPTSVPEEAILEGRIAFSPDEDVESARKVVEEAVYQAAQTDPWLKEHPPVVEWYGFCLNSGKIEEDHPMMEVLKENYQAIKGEEAEISGTPWGTDAGALIRYGHTPTIVFGPGPRHTAHQANEYVEEETLLLVAKVIASAMIDWCGVSSEGKKEA